MSDISTIAIAKQAFQHFTHGLATGEWEAFLAMLADDFTFWFPAGPYRGWNTGKARAEEFFRSVSKVFDRGLIVTLERTTCNETTVVFEVRSQGSMLGHPYENQAAISFDVRGDRIVQYREYLGAIFQLTPPS
jgi:ketosteroid isomerase-like protein